MLCGDEILHASRNRTGEGRDRFAVQASLEQRSFHF
jgi:hypothetical protein